jgi:hypothetical protein
MEESDDTENRTDAKLSFPSAALSGAGDTLRVSPGPIPERKTVIQAEFCTFALHSSNTAKMWVFRSCGMNNF